MLYQLSYSRILWLSRRLRLVVLLRRLPAWFS